MHLVHLGEGQNVKGQDFGDVTNPQITDIAGQNLVVAHGNSGPRSRYYPVSDPEVVPYSNIIE